VHLDDRAVEGNGFDFDLNDLLSLHGLEDLIQNAALGPAHHAGVDRVPGSKMLGEAPPFAALFGDIQNGIEDLKVGESHIAALNREAMGDLLVLGFADFHPRNLPEYVLTGPRKTNRFPSWCNNPSLPRALQESSGERQAIQGTLGMKASERNI
jgi:hypothetical protein